MDEKRIEELARDANSPYRDDTTAGIDEFYVQKTAKVIRLAVNEALSDIICPNCGKPIQELHNASSIPSKCVIDQNHQR